MGSLYGWYTRKDVIRHLIKDDEPRLKTLAHCVRGNILWTVQKWDNTADPFIGCYILLGPVKGDGNDPYACGYKGMDESVHPYYYNCPVRYLDMAPEVCPEWRAIVRKHAAARATKLKVGLIAELKTCTIPAVEITSVKPLRGRANWTTYRLTRSLLSGRTFASWDEFKEATA